uniref:J domain-containing protein n=1 Tax=Cannabis sativa TaxID=3483 RepID=A0A803PXP0_CANSA
MERTAEAKRWLSTAEKLLAARDHLGAKSFAIRVREVYPGLETVDDLVAVADTLHAAEQRINNQYDWYAILQLPRYTQNMELVATQYRRLALLLNPHRNRLPHSDEAFQLVTEAWAVLSNQTRRNFFHSELNMFARYDFGAPAGPGSGSAQPQVQTQSREQTPPQPQSREQLLPQPQFQPQQQQHHQMKEQPQPQPQPQLQQSQSKEHTQPQSQPLPQQQPQPARKDLGTIDGRVEENEEEEERPNLNNVAESTRASLPTETIEEAEYEGESFWTACPYCYVLYEYPKGYEECVLRCQNCKRAFHAAVIPSPPVRGKEDTYFCCWGFFPLGFSGNAKDVSGSSGWTPFSPMFSCPIQTPGNRSDDGKGKRPRGGSPRFIYRDDDIFVELSDDSDESDDADWRNTRRLKRTRTSTRSRNTPTKNAKTTSTTTNTTRVTRASQNVGARDNGSSANGENVNGAIGSSKGPQSRGELRKTKAVASGGKKKGAVERSKLDLNVEFSNDVEESATTGVKNKGREAGHGEEDNIEGNGFFEGLDEFLSSLPILNVVGDDKVKAA